MPDEPVPPRGDGLVRVRLDLAYDGTEFSGWAAQPGRRTVQGTLEDALATIVREPARLTVAGRTDAGVHARGQVAHADLLAASVEAPAGLLRRLAAVLPRDVRVMALGPAPTGFDARFSALSRRYAYRLCDSSVGPDPLRRHDVLWQRRPLDADAMQAVASSLLGEHDFAAFCRRREGASTVRRLLRLEVGRHVEAVVVVDVEADAFCRSMVRALVGALVAVGEGRRPVDWPAQVLAGRRRDPAVTVVPARGLTLEQVRYPPEDRLAARAAETRAVRLQDSSQGCRGSEEGGTPKRPVPARR